MLSLLKEDNDEEEQASLSDCCLSVYVITFNIRKGCKRDVNSPLSRIFIL